MKLRTNDTANNLIANIYELDKLLGFKRTAHKRKLYRLTKKLLQLQSTTQLQLGEWAIT
mgnify:FL=1